MTRLADPGIGDPTWLRLYRCAWRWRARRPIRSPRAKRERRQRRVGSAAGRDNDELAARARFVGHRVGARSKRRRHSTNLPAGALVESVEIRIAATDEDEAPLR